MIILQPDQNYLRIYQHESITTDDGQESINMKRIKKIYMDDMSSQINLKTVHTALSTEDETFFILSDDKDMVVFDMRTAELNKDVGGYVVKKVYRYESCNLQGMQLIEDRYLYVTYNQTF